MAEKKTTTVDITAQLSATRLAAKAELRKANLHLPRRPRYEQPRLPLNLTDLPDEDVMQLFTKFTRYQDHLAGQLAEAEIDEHSIETMLEYAKARYLAASWTGATTDRVAVQKAEALMDIEVQAYEKALEERRAKRKLYGVVVDSLARDAALLSREISRRIGRDPVERRADRWTP